MRRTNARTELHDEIKRTRAEAFRHRPDRNLDDAQLRSFFSRVHQPDCFARRIHEINGAAIGDINTEANAGLICDDAIAAGKTFVAGGR